MADKKLSYQMVSPGEAWNNFVNSKDGHNAAAVTPSYLDASSKSVAEKSSLAETDSKVVTAKPKLYDEAIKNSDSKGTNNKDVDKEYGHQKEDAEKEK